MIKAPSPEATRTTSQPTPVDEKSDSPPLKDDSVGPDVPRISQPSKFDILFGRGKPFQGHAGNIRLHKVVDLYKPRYSQARRHEKTEIAEEIVQFVKTGGAKAGRFLKRLENEEVWVEVSDSVARDKVSHALRGKPRKESNKGLQSQGMLEELLSAKRSLGDDGFTGPLAKKQKVAQPMSELELLAAQRNNTLGSNMAAGNAFFMGSQGLSSSMQQQLLANALAERQMAAGLMGQQMGGMGLLGQQTSGIRQSMIPGAPSPSDINPILLQRLAAERQLRADPRMWM
eukprot:Nitzschia sp. Nitz4//scaffold17_size182527//76857//77714//NITZ4_001850-RA/size182527-processed-gene-0.51-mRNA-1//-1//CDS//3329539328//8767//frame0